MLPVLDYLGSHHARIARECQAASQTLLQKFLQIDLQRLGRGESLIDSGTQRMAWRAATSQRV